MNVARYYSIPSALVLLVGAIFLFSMWLVGSVHFAQQPDLLALSLTVDMTIVLPFVYFLIARRYGIPLLSVIPVFILSIVAASAIIPEPNHQYLDIVKLLIGPIEAGVAVLLVISVRRNMRRFRELGTGRYDFIETLRRSLANSIGNRIALNALTSEIAVFYYALMGWKNVTEVPRGTLAFSYHKTNAYTAVAGLITMLIIVETVALHLALSLWSDVAAWIFSALSLYSMVFILGDLNAARRRPIIVDAKSLSIRIGLRWRVSIPLDNLESVTRVSAMPPEKNNECLNAVLFGRPNIILNLGNSQDAVGIYGITKRFKHIALFVDDVAEFEKALSQIEL